MPALPPCLRVQRTTVVRIILRTAVVLLLMVPAIAFFCWLVLTSADFLGIVHFGKGLTREWGDFALRVSLGILLPPALVAGFNFRVKGSICLLEATRASLITFMFFALGFFAVGFLAIQNVSGMHIALLPIILGRVGPLIMCLLLYISYKIISCLLPLPVQTEPAPASVRSFSLPAALLILSMPIQALAPLSPLGLPSLSASYYDLRALPQDVFLFSSVAWLIRYRGIRLFRPVFVAICILGPLLLLHELGDYPLPWQLFHIGQAIVAVAACACLYTRPAGRWFVS